MHQRQMQYSTHLPKVLAACLATALTLAPATARVRPRSPLAPATKYAGFVVEKVATAAGMAATPPIFRAPVDAARAIYVDGREAIVYNPDFLDEVNLRAGTPWAAVSVIAHELGHHYYRHSADPVDTLPPETLRERELVADYFSGFVLARMGASVEDAEAAQEALYDDASTPTHPDSARRLRAITAGWSDGESGSAPTESPSDRIEAADAALAAANALRLAPGPASGPAPFPGGRW